MGEQLRPEHKYKSKRTYTWVPLFYFCPPLPVQRADNVSLPSEATPFPKAQHYRHPSPLSIASDQSSSSASTRPYPLQLDTAVMSTRTSLVSTSSPASSTLVDHVTVSNARRSSDSVRTVPGAPFRRDRATQDRSMSMSAASGSIRTMIDRGIHPQLPHMEGRNSPTSSMRPPRRAPIVYPALLSRVAEAFRERVTVQDRIKDGLTYKDAFDGREAVDKIAYIIKTTDRNLALLLGRALDAQKFFHDVTYDHRLRDSPAELYQFRTKLSPFVSGELQTNFGDKEDDGDLKPERPALKPEDSRASGGSGLSGQGSNDSHGDTQERDASPITEIPEPHGRQGSESIDEVPLPSGVFTLLTDCYSPTCTRDQLCYSIACPRRLEQQSRLNMKPQPGLKKQISRESLGDFVVRTMVITSVMLIVSNLSRNLAHYGYTPCLKKLSIASRTPRKGAKKLLTRLYTRNETLFATWNTFVMCVLVLHTSYKFLLINLRTKVWINGLKDSDIIPADRRADFITQVFWNIHEIIAVNTRLRDALNKRQKSYAVVERIGDILLDAVPHFGPFVSYGAHQLYGKYEFEKEKSSNPAFAQFVEVSQP